MRSFSYTSLALFLAGSVLGAGAVALFGQGGGSAAVPALVSEQPQERSGHAPLADTDVATRSRDGKRPQSRLARKQSAPAARISGVGSDSRVLLTKHPPPHVADASFYAPFVTDDEAEEMRAAALEDLIAAMEAEGMPEEDIEAMAQAASSMSEAHSAVLDDPGLVAPTVDEVAEDLALSMEEADIPHEDIAAMIDAEYVTSEDLESAQDELLDAPNPEMH